MVADVRDVALGRPPEVTVFLMGSFSVLAFLLATLGVYGMMAYSATLRAREIGIRMALGAQGSDVLRLIVGEGLALVAPGIGLGLLGAVAINRTLAGMVFGITTTDANTEVMVTLAWMAAALLACYLPARRVASVDPMVALRYE